MLYAAATKLRSMWNIIKITSHPDDPDRTPRVDADWARQMIQAFGEDDAWIKSSIMGTFPDSAINTLLSMEEIEAAVNRTVLPADYQSQQRRLGIDVARYGMDPSVIFPRQGLKAFNPVTLRGASTQELTARVVMAKNNWNSEVEFIDGSGGHGAGLVDNMLSMNLAPQEIHFSGKALSPQFFNRRAEMYFLMSKWIKRGGSIPDVPELIKELAAVTYSFKNGRIILEDKDMLKKRVGHSLDYADSLALTFCLPEMPTSLGMPEFKKTLGEYNPFAESETEYRPPTRHEYDPFANNQLHDCKKYH